MPRIQAVIIQGPLSFVTCGTEPVAGVVAGTGRASWSACQPSSRSSSPCWALLLPIPEDAVAILAGATLAANAPVSTLVACVVGAWFGDALLFFAGRLCASSLDRLPRARHFFDPKKSARAQSMLDRWGDLAYVIARVVPGVRGAVFFGAGVFGRPARRFVLIDAVAALVHVPLLVLAGTALGPRVVAVAISLGRVGTAVVIAFAIVGVVLVSVSPKPSARTEPPD